MNLGSLATSMVAATVALSACGGQSTTGDETSSGSATSTGVASSGGASSGGASTGGTGEGGYAAETGGPETGGNVAGTGSQATGGTDAGGYAAQPGGGAGTSGGVTAGTGSQATGGAGGVAPTGGAAGVQSGGTGNIVEGAECGDIQYIGACVGDTYVWCDYFTGKLKTLGCPALGLSCRSDPVIPGEDFTNGCVGEMPDVQMPTCDGRLILQIHNYQLLVRDCEQSGGPGSVCGETHDYVEDDHYAYCEHATPCSPPYSASCDGGFLRVCEDTGTLELTSCAAHGVTCAPTTTSGLGFGCVFANGSGWPG